MAKVYEGTKPHKLAFGVWPICNDDYSCNNRLASYNLCGGPLTK